MSESAKYVMERIETPHLPDEKELAFIPPEYKELIAERIAGGATVDEVWPHYVQGVKESIYPYTEEGAARAAKAAAEAEHKGYSDIFAGEVRTPEAIDILAARDKAIARLQAKHEAAGMLPDAAAAHAKRAILFPFLVARTTSGTPAATVGADPADPFETEGMTDLDVLFEAYKPQVLLTETQKQRKALATAEAQSILSQLEASTIEAMARSNEDIYKALLALELKTIQDQYDAVASGDVPFAEMASIDTEKASAIRALGFRTTKEDGKNKVLYDEPGMPKRPIPSVDMDLISHAVVMLSDQPDWESYKSIFSSVFSAKTGGRAKKEKLFNDWVVHKSGASQAVQAKHLDEARLMFIDEAKEQIALDAKMRGEELTDLQLHKKATAYGSMLYNAYEQSIFPGVEEFRHSEYYEKYGGVTIGDFTYRIEGEAAHKLKYLHYTKDQQGRVVETWIAAGMRGLAGTIRFATDPAMEAISYDVDSDGKPLDESDPNYQLAMAVNDALGSTVGTGWDPRDWDLSKAPVAWYGSMLPATFARERSRISTGNYVRDVAIGIARGESLATDFNELAETTTIYKNFGMDWVPTAAGIMVEVGLPITPIPIVKVPVQALSGITAAKIRKTANSMSSASKAASGAHLNYARALGFGDYAAAAGRMAASSLEFINSPKMWSRQQAIYREALAGIKAADKSPGLVHRTEIMDEARSFVRGVEESRLPNAIANRVAGGMVKSYLDGTLGTVPETKIGMIANLIDDADKMLRAAHNGGGAAWKSLEESIIGRQIKDAYVAAKTAGYADGSRAIRERILTTIAQDALKESLAHSIPNNWALVAGNIAVPVKEWMKHGRGVMAKARSVLKNTVDKSGTVYENGSEVVRLLSETLGWSKVDATPYWSGIRAKLLNNKPLTLDEANSVHGAAVGGLLKESMTGSVQLKYAGPAYVKGRGRGGQPSVLESMGWTPDLAKGETVFSATGEVLKGIAARINPFSKSAKIETKGFATVEAQQLVERVNNRLTRLDLEFTSYLNNKRKENREGFLEEVFTELSSDDVVGDLMDILNMFFGDGVTWNKVFGKPGAKLNMRASLEAIGFGEQPLSPELIKKAINYMRSKHSGLAQEGIKPRTTLGTVAEKFKINTDQPDLAMFAWMMDKYKDKVVGELVDPFIKSNPELLIKAGGDDIADMQAARTILKQATVNGVNFPPNLIEPLLRIIYKGKGDASGLSPSQFRHMVELIITDVFEKGGLLPGSSLRFSEVIMSSLTESQIVRISSLRAEARKVVTQNFKQAGAKLSDSSINKVAEEFVKVFIDSFIQASTDINLDRIVGQLRASGVSIPVGGFEKLGASLRPELLGLTDEFSILVDRGAVTSLEIKAFQGLLDASASEKLWQGLNRMRETDVNAFTLVATDLIRFTDMIRRSAVGGLLGGFPLPGYRFLSTNLLTAPFISMVTTPAYISTAMRTLLTAPLTAAAKTSEPLTAATRAALARVTGGRKLPGTQAFNWMYNSLSRNPDEVVMVDVWGRRWTKARLNESIRTSNIQYTQTTFEFREKVFDMLRRTIATTPGLKKASWLRQAWRYMNPANKNLWSVLAENTDLAFREAVYVEALRRGLTESQAAEVGRNVLLDYGKVTEVERAWATRGMLFYAFQRQMMVEVLGSLIRDPTAARAIRAQVSFVKNQHEDSGTWMLEPDYARARAWSYAGQNFDRVGYGGIETYHYGPPLPALESFISLVAVMGASIDYYNFNRLTKEAPRPEDPGIPQGWEGSGGQYAIGTALRESIGGTFREDYTATPIVDLALDLFETKGREGDHRYTVDPRWMYFFQKSGTFELAQNNFGIVESDKQARPGRPTYQGKEWKMDANGYAAFRAVQFASLALGLERAIRDGATVAMRAEDSPSDWRFKYLGEGNPVLYSTSLDTTMPVPDEFQMHYEVLLEIERDLKALE